MGITFEESSSVFDNSHDNLAQHTTRANARIIQNIQEQKYHKHIF